MFSELGYGSPSTTNHQWSSRQKVWNDDHGVKMIARGLASALLSSLSTARLRIWCTCYMFPCVCAILSCGTSQFSHYRLTVLYSSIFMVALCDSQASRPLHACEIESRTAEKAGFFNCTSRVGAGLKCVMTASRGCRGAKDQRLFGQVSKFSPWSAQLGGSRPRIQHNQTLHAHCVLFFSFGYHGQCALPTIWSDIFTNLGLPLRFGLRFGLGPQIFGTQLAVLMHKALKGKHPRITQKVALAFWAANFEEKTSKALNQRQDIS